ncbi:late competence development ComFB family protein [Roseofilum reptotaenium CS-1145]|uniref:Late competence development ComFB family protein n=1 Tax=Roseofilum reptotaenium AO1-A TaxID=1925591 RepID=A0A1L9QN63_9CYAN|nr:late competence development ComFB family protein [Roseofilum reptotaenium]MDB9515740.1 late competence development ComFB family protein [Roseofilum reptotaenium CS-1145]OJJ24082.1 hypothetical protein BI308_18575 [Roseofilum reptotaenium AO1-A]
MNRVTHLDTHHHYGNVTEVLAIEEVERQLKDVSVDLSQTINKTDAVAYALNRLPSMYATTEEGYEWQKQQAKKRLSPLITQAAKWGINAAQRNKKRFATPLFNQNQAEVTLRKLRVLLGREDLNWENLVSAIEEYLNLALSTKID